MSLRSLRGVSEWALMVTLVLGAGVVAQAQQEESQDPVIQIGEADEGATAPVGVEDPQVVQQPAPKYWIGLAGGNIPADHILRYHVELPEGQGLLVANVVPDSPADKAGLKQYDVLLRANDIELHEMHDLIDLVSDSGAKKAEMKLEVLRHGKHETVSLTPEDRPADAPRLPGGQGGGFEGNFGPLGEGGIPREFFQQFRGQLPREFRNFDSGVIVEEEGQGAVNIPDGVSVNISKQEGKPTHITVQRGDEKWEVSADDEASLEKLPKDLRPAVKQMLQGASPMDLHSGGLEQHPRPELRGQRLNERMEQMEKRMQELMERLERSAPAEDKADEQTK